MSISDYNLSGAQKRNLDHFASIVRLALSDNVIAEEEKDLLRRIAKRLHILEDKYNEILKNPTDYPVDAPQSYDERIEHLFDLTKMMFVDGKVANEEVNVLKKVSIGLGFPIKNVEKIVNKAIDLFEKDCDLECFSEAIKKVNRI